MRFLILVFLYFIKLSKCQIYTAFLIKITIPRSIKNCVKDIFKENFDATFEHLANNGQGGGGKVSEEDMRSLMFGDFMRPDLDKEERFYEEIKIIDSMYGIVEQCLDEYNNTHKNKMNLVIFRLV
jgi:dynein heavy chain